MIRAAKTTGGNLDSPEIHALETDIELPDPEPAFTVYTDIRQKLIEADLVDCMVAMPGQLFYSTQIPVCLWFLTKSKPRTMWMPA